MDSSPTSRYPSLPVPPVAGVKRPAPSLLPAFEPFSSSPSLPRPAKRIAQVSPSRYDEKHKYPTPIPTSSTGVVSSSPPPLPCTRRPGLFRTFSTFSERTPLSAVPSIELDEHGEPTLLGRSSNSSHYQLSTNKLISRVHVRAVYIPADPPASRKIQVECMGWNGVKVHCQGRAWELRKGDSFTSETEDADIMVDVQDARVLVQWPRHDNKLATPTDSESAWDEENSPSRTNGAPRRASPNQSPLRHRLQSPVSPSPAVHAIGASSTLLVSHPPIPIPVLVYEDEQSGDEGDKVAASATEGTQSTQFASQPLGTGLRESQSSLLSESNDFSDCDEENDPVVHSFGPFGSNLMPRMESFTTGDAPIQRRPLNPLKEASISPQRRHSIESTGSGDVNPVVNHVINQLAYSRLSSTPLSTLMDHLLALLKIDSPGLKENSRCLSLEKLKKMLDATKCIGEVPRSGKDAAGKPLESEYYYIADLDSDEKRRDAVVQGLQKPGLRACRKQHKVCYFSHILGFSHDPMDTNTASSNITGGSQRCREHCLCWRWFLKAIVSNMDAFLSFILFSVPYLRAVPMRTSIKISLHSEVFVFYCIGVSELRFTMDRGPKRRVS